VEVSGQLVYLWGRSPHINWIKGYLGPKVDDDVMKEKLMTALT
jgi:hypothetical protein